jgi:hypothetical protein
VVTTHAVPKRATTRAIGGAELAAR